MTGTSETAGSIVMDFMPLVLITLLFAVLNITLLRRLGTKSLSSMVLCFIPGFQLFVLYAALFKIADRLNEIKPTND
jgi:lipopolysaccharide export LptBFGC system permease protein LptF